MGSEILSKKSSYCAVAVRSTLPFGTSELLRKELEESSGLVCGKSFGFVYNPEMLAVGDILGDIYNPDFVVIGEFDSRSGSYLSRLKDGLAVEERSVCGFHKLITWRHAVES